ncbi:MAG: hypothetical protein LBG93_05580 [Treponema sp.]|nr:hypothetical protein [Treponema sp.]
MGKITEWESDYNGKTYAFSHEKVKGSHILKINGEPTIIKNTMRSIWLGLDEPFTFEGKKARLAMYNNAPDVVVDGMFLKSGKPYVEMPGWLLVFFVLLFPLVILGGGAGGICMVIGALVCQKISRVNKADTVRVALCTAVTLCAWLVWIISARITAA